MPDDAHLVGCADDVEQAKRKVNQVIIRTKSWLEDKGLKFATEKNGVDTACEEVYSARNRYHNIATLTTRKVSLALD